MDQNNIFLCKFYLYLLNVRDLRYILSMYRVKLESNEIRDSLIQKIERLINDPLISSEIAETIITIAKKPPAAINNPFSKNIFAQPQYWPVKPSRINILSPNTGLSSKKFEKMPAKNLNRKKIPAATKTAQLPALSDFLVDYVFVAQTEIPFYPFEGKPNKIQARLSLRLFDKWQTIINSKKLNNNIFSYDFNVFLRIGTYFNNNQYQDCFPRFLSLKVNEKRVLNNDKKYENFHPGILPITEFCFLEPFTHNLIDMSYEKTNRKFFYTIFIGKTRSISEMLDFIKNKSYFSKNSTLNILKKQLKNSHDIKTDTFLDVSLRCPISFSKIEFPVRFLNCNHIQCFDLFSFLSLNSNNKLYKCPICEISGTLNNLQVDSFMFELCKKFDYDRIVRVKPDLSYSVLESKAIKIENVIDDCISNINKHPLIFDDVEVISIHTDSDIDVIVID